MVEIGFPTAAFNPDCLGLKNCFARTLRDGLRRIGCTAMDGVSWIHGPGGQPHMGLWGSPLLPRQKITEKGDQLPRIEVALFYPGPEAPRPVWSLSCTPSGGPGWKAAPASTPRRTVICLRR